MIRWNYQIPLDPPLQKGEDLGLSFAKGVKLCSPLFERGARGDFHTDGQELYEINAELMNYDHVQRTTSYGSS